MRVMPDAEEAAVTYLKSVAEVAALAGARIDTKLPPPATAVFPLLVLRRTGGVRAVSRILDGPTIQVEAWDDIPSKGGSRARANLTARTAHAALLAWHGTVADIGVVIAVDEVLGIGWQPDPPTNRPRYIFEVLVGIRPLPGA